eukprot:scaffold3767_cov114-Isochrysis_galbana.AAC.11
MQTHVWRTRQQFLLHDLHHADRQAPAADSSPSGGMSGRHRPRRASVAPGRETRPRRPRTTRASPHPQPSSRL